MLNFTKLTACFLLLAVIWSCSQELPSADHLNDDPVIKKSNTEEQEKDHDAEEESLLASSFLALGDSHQQDLSLSFWEEEQTIRLDVPADYHTPLLSLNLALPSGYQAYLQEEELSETFTLDLNKWGDDQEDNLILRVVHKEETVAEYTLQRSTLYNLAVNPSFIEGKSYDTEIFSRWKTADIHGILEYGETIEISLGVDSHIPSSLVALSALREDSPVSPQEVLLESPDRIVFYKPGRYTISLSLNEEALENRQAQFSKDAATTLRVDILPNLPSQRFRSALKYYYNLDSAFDRYDMLNTSHQKVLDRTLLRFSHDNIPSFHGIHHFVNLEELTMQGGGLLEDFDFSSLPKLKKIDLAYISWSSDIFDFTQNTALEGFYLQHNGYSRLREIKLPNQGKLKTLHLIGDYPDRSELEKFLEENPPLLKTLDIQGEPNLEWINLDHYYGLEEILFPSSLDALTHLFLRHIPIRHLDISKATLLRGLDIVFTNLTVNDLIVGPDTAKDVVLPPGYFYHYAIDSKFLPSFMEPELNKVLGHSVALHIYEDGVKTGIQSGGVYYPLSPAVSE